MDDLQIWMTPLRCGCVAREVLNTKLLAEIKYIKKSDALKKKRREKRMRPKFLDKKCPPDWVYVGGLCVFWLGGAALWYLFIMKGVK